MTKYSYDWFIEQSRLAQESVGKWPASMRENIVLGSATLPVLGEKRLPKEPNEPEQSASKENPTQD